MEQCGFGSGIKIVFAKIPLSQWYYEYKEGYPQHYY
jgi:hypothetical protein